MELNILYTVNDKYIDIMLVSLTSLVLNNKTYDKLKFHIICSDFDITDYKRIDEYTKKFTNVEIEFYSLDKFAISRFNIPEWRGNQTANARLFYQSIINPIGIKRLLYLDADTIVVGDLSDLEDKDEMLMAVKDSCLNYYLDVLNVKSYYNSGVLLFDTERWAKESCEDRIIKYLEKNPNQKLNFPDQDILNLVLSEEISPLEYQYNIGPYSLIGTGRILEVYYNKKYRQIACSEVEESLKSPKIYHSYGLLGIKPWSNNKINPLNDLFMEYMNLIDENFSKEELHGLKKILNSNPVLFDLLLLIRTYMPPEIENNIRKLSLCTYKNYTKD